MNTALFSQFSLSKRQVEGLVQEVMYVKVTRPSFFGVVPSYFEALWYPHLYFYPKSNT